ncbi:MAG: hypothetical protein E7372_02875 [Clostridiales bacterium]|nr:hypothetical protein [Clostridiales bacterium]
MARRKYTKEEVKQIRKERKIKAALRSYRCRGLKNFLFWLTGLISAFVLLISAIFVGVKFIPISTYVGDTGEVVSKDVSSKSILDAILDAQTYDMSDFPFIVDSIYEFSTSSEIKDYVKVDKEKLSSLKFDSNFGKQIASCVEITATLEGIGVTKDPKFKDICKLDIFNKWEEVADGEYPILDANGNIERDTQKVGSPLKSNPNIYYYKVSTNKYAKAFDENGNKQAVFSKLYYPNLAQIPLLDAVQVLGDSFSRLKINNMLESLGGGSGFSNSFIGGILEGKKISDLQNLTGEDIVLVNILKQPNETLTSHYEKNKMFYDVLCSILPGNPTFDTINLAHLQGSLSFNDLKLTTILKKDGETLEQHYRNNKMFYDVLRESIPGNPEYYEITILDLQQTLEFENIKLITILMQDDETEQAHYENNKMFYDVLCSLASGKPKYNELTVLHLKGNLHFEDVKLSTILIKDGETEQDHYKNNKMLYDILCSAIPGNKTWDKLTISDLQSELDFDNIKLTTILMQDGETEETHYKKYKELYDILCLSVGLGSGAENFSKLTIAHLHGEMHYEYIYLDTFVHYVDDESEKDNTKFYKILLSGCGYQNVNEMSKEALKTAAKSLKLSELDSFSEGNITLVNIIGDVTTSNKMLEALLKRNPTISNLGSAIETLSLFDVYGQACFEERGRAVNSNTPTYDKVEDIGGEYYVLNEQGNGEYVLSQNAGVWLILCYEPSEVVLENTVSNYNGCRISYRPTDKTLGDLQDGLNISQKIGSATIRELVIIGLLEDSLTLKPAYSGTLQDALEQIKFGK